MTFVLLATRPALAQNTPESDYQFQLDQYNRHHAEFSIYQKDYLRNNTLDNEQKAIQTAKSTLLARELVMHSYMRILRQSIESTGIVHPAITAIYGSMDMLGTYYQQQTSLINSIQTKQDLANYTAAYLVKLQENQSVLDSAQIINKFSQLMRFEKELESHLALLTPNLEPKRNLILVQSSLQEIGSMQQKIRTDLEAIALAGGEANVAGGYRQDLFRKVTIQIVSVQSTERKIAERLIDLDTNYVAK